jgi:hypothetical protein
MKKALPNELHRHLNRNMHARMVPPHLSQFEHAISAGAGPPRQLR